MDAATILQTAQTWSSPDQLDFLIPAWDQFAESADKPEVSNELRLEIRRRLAGYKADPTDVLTWEEVEAHLRMSP